MTRTQFCFASALVCSASALAVMIALTAPAQADDTATAALKSADGKDVGTVTLTAVPTGVLLDVNVTNLPAGTHAFHIHETGLCEGPDFKSAGGHYNPEEDKHGLMNPAGPHAGDMPNIHVPANGQLRIEVLNQMVNLDSLLDEEGTAIVIHEGPDDYKSDPAGDAGPRLACGVIAK